MASFSRALVENRPLSHGSLTDNIQIPREHYTLVHALLFLVVLLSRSVSFFQNTSSPALTQVHVHRLLRFPHHLQFQVLHSWSLAFQHFVYDIGLIVVVFYQLEQVFYFLVFYHPCNHLSFITIFPP